MLRAFLSGAVFGETHGSGAPWVLALHGWQRSHEDFAAVLSGGTAPLDSIALDLPGFGASPPPPLGWSTDEYAAALSDVLDACAERVVVLGHSFGGRVALHLARRNPARVCGLVISGVPMPASDRPRPKAPLGYRLVRRLGRAGVVSEARLESARERYGSADYRGATGVMREVLVRCVGESYDTELAEIEAPIELVWGEDDTAAPPSDARRAVSIARAAHLELLPGVDHFTPERAPEKLRAALLGLRDR